MGDYTYFSPFFIYRLRIFCGGPLTRNAEFSRADPEGVRIAVRFLQKRRGVALSDREFDILFTTDKPFELPV